MRTLHIPSTAHAISLRPMRRSQRVLPKRSYTDTGIDFADHDIVIYKITAVSADGTTESMGVHDVINHATQKQIDRWQLMHEEKDVAPYYDQWIKY